MDLLRIFRMQEPVSLKTKNSECLGECKEQILEKDVILRNHLTRIDELEKEVADLKLQKNSDVNSSEFQNVMAEYEEFFQKVWAEREKIIERNATLEKHIENLEASYNKLMEKFEKSKSVIIDLKENEDKLLKELEEYHRSINLLEEKYKNLKEHSQERIASANEELDNKEKGNIKEVSKLKAKILQSQARISELEKHVRDDFVFSRQSMFEPLKSNISKV